ncbi:MAG: hypothetical protein IJ659_02570 [Alloprevotella sp.]|nr:hypothetical protein [Alloprevotella sp.]
MNKPYRNIIRRTLLLAAALGLFAGLQARTSDEQPARAVFNVFTYRADGSLIGNTYGFFTQADGTGITSYQLFVGASRAEVIDAQGNKLPVSRILGASSTMDLLKIRVETKKPTDFLPVATASAREGSELLLVNYSTKKKTPPTGIRIEKATDFNGNGYYDLSAANAERNFGCPLVNAAGEAVAIVQKNVGRDAKTACALDAKAAEGLKITTTSALNSDLTRLQIPRILPESEKDALSYVYMLGSAPEAVQQAALDDFIAAFPDNAEGYVNRGNFLGGLEGKREEARSDFGAALERAENAASTMKTDEVHHALSKLLFRWALTAQAEDFNALCEEALAEEEAAYAAEPNPLYLQQQAEILIMSDRLPEALARLKDFNRSDLTTPESLYREVQVLQAMDADSLTVLAAMDKVIAKMEKPYSSPQAAAYILARAMQRVRLGMNRDAIQDFNEYEKIVGPQQLSHNFYYVREQTERQARMFQQALDDIRSAEARSSGEDYDLYRLEEMSLLVQVQLNNEAIACGEDLLRRLPDEGLVHRLLGVAYGEKGEKSRAQEHLRRAAALGETNLEPLMNKYK